MEDSDLRSLFGASVHGGGVWGEGGSGWAFDAWKDVTYSARREGCFPGVAESIRGDEVSLVDCGKEFGAELFGGLCGNCGRGDYGVTASGISRAWGAVSS